VPRDEQRVRIQMSFWSDLAGKASSGHTDRAESSFKPRVRGSNPRAGTSSSDRLPLGWRFLDYSRRHWPQRTKRFVLTIEGCSEMGEVTRAGPGGPEAARASEDALWYSSAATNDCRNRLPRLSSVARWGKWATGLSIPSVRTSVGPSNESAKSSRTWSERSAMHGRGDCTTGSCPPQSGPAGETSGRPNIR
jgi:hypothetical protein